MGPYRLAPLLLVVLVLTGVVGCAAPGVSLDLAGRDRVELPALRVGDVLLARVAVEGHRPGWWLVDTGSTINLLDDDLAERLNLPVVDRRAYVGLAGRQELTIRRVDALRMGPARLGAHELGSCDLEPFSRALGVPVEGLLSCQSFAAAAVTLDYPGRRIVLHRRGGYAPPPGAASAELAAGESTPHIRGRFGRRREGLFLLDSGNTASVDLDMRFYREQTRALLRGPIDPARIRRFVGFGGVGYCVETEPQEFRLFGRVLSEVPTTINIAPAAAPDRGRAGIVGSGLLSRWRVTFDLTGRRVWLEPAEGPVAEANDAAVAAEGRLAR